MHWTFECSDVVEFIGYDVEYCITVSKYNFKCQGKKLICLTNADY